MGQLQGKQCNTLDDLNGNQQSQETEVSPVLGTGQAISML